MQVKVLACQGLSWCWFHTVVDVIVVRVTTVRKSRFFSRNAVEYPWLVSETDNLNEIVAEYCSI